MRNIIIASIVIFVVIAGVYFFFIRGEEETGLRGVQDDIEQVTETGTATSTEEVVVDDTRTVIGQSVEGNDITAYHYGEGDVELLFVGGVHGGYSWNTARVAIEFMEYLEANPEEIPENIRVTVIPVLNPDGLEAVVGTTSPRFNESDVSESEATRVAGRFNGNNVDLNRNFDCEWQPESTWQSRTVSGGSAAFSEPEARAFRDFVNANDLDAVVVWYSAAGGVFASNCRSGVLPETAELTDLYAEAAGYRAFGEFNFYEITGDMVNWLAKEGVPAISVLLTNHEDTEWAKNRAGIEAMFEFYAQSE